VKDSLETKPRLLNHFIILLVSFILFWPTLGHGVIEVGNIDNINAGSWTGQSLVIGDDNICVRFDRGCDRGRGCRARRNYSLVAMGVGVGGSFVVSKGAEEIPFRLYYNDGAGVAGRVEILPGQAIMSLQNAQAGQCGPADNGNFSVEFDVVDLYHLSAGDYAATVEFVLGRNNGRGETLTSEIDVLINIADVVQLTGLDDVGLTPAGAYLQGGDDFCVYRNGSAGYRVAVSSGNGGAQGAFILRAGTEQVSYEVFYDHVVAAGSNGVLLAEGVPSGGFTGSGVYSAGCMTENASIYIRARADLFQRFGSYSDTLTIEIIPE